jgi:cobalt/nickel transport system permease protein
MPLSLLAVHLSDGALATAWWASGFGGLAAMLAIALWKVREEDIPRIGVLTAAFFVASSIHIKLAVLPTSVHLILNGLNACIVGVPALAAGAAYPLLRRLGVPAFARGVLLGGGAVAVAVVLNFLALLFGGKDDWQMLAKLVLLAHVPVVVIEGLMLGVLVSYLEKVKPEMLGSGERPAGAQCP